MAACRVLVSLLHELPEDAYEALCREPHALFRALLRGCSPPPLSDAATLSPSLEQLARVLDGIPPRTVTGIEWLRCARSACDTTQPETLAQLTHALLLGLAAAAAGDLAAVSPV